jgi:endonuclease/exonuclease/phosphatase family metal-dependent hydrolase
LLLVLSVLGVWAQYTDAYWWVVLINLALPILFLFALASVIFGKLFGKVNKRAWITFWLLFFGCWNNWNLPNFPEDRDENSFRLATYNVRLFDHYNWINRATWDKWAPRTDNGRTFDSLYHFIQGFDADILCFQEFFYQKNGPLQSVKVFRDQFNYPHVSLGINYREGDNNYGMATFSNYPIVRHRTHFFEDKKSNGFIISDIDIKGDTVRVINAHLESFRFDKSDYTYFESLKNAPVDALSWRNTFTIIKRLRDGSERRRLQRDRLLLEIRDSPYPVILSGDFNELPQSRWYELITDELADGFKESENWLGSTHTGPLPGFRIDYNFYDEEHIEVIGQNTIHSPVLSDHYPIVTDFKVCRD